MNLPQNEFLICTHLSNSFRDTADIASFQVRPQETGHGLEVYLKQYAYQDELAGVMRTYLVRFKPTNECVGYFSLKAGLVSINEMESKNEINFDTIPGIEIANFALNSRFTEKYNAKGLGSVLFSKLIAPFIQSHAETIGICVIYLFSLPHERLIKTYENYGFHRLPTKAEEQLHQRMKPSYDQSCIFMYQLLNEIDL